MERPNTVAGLIEKRRELEDRPARVLVADHAAALRADRLAIGSRPPDLRNMSLASLSDMRATDARESVRALAERRKCWHIVIASGDIHHLI